MTGLCRSSVRSSNAETSATLQPFFALQLDIQSSTVHSVMEALLENFSSEQLEGSWLADQEQQQQQLPSRVLTLSLEELPPVLILHLKRMLYDGSTGGCVKVSLVFFYVRYLPMEFFNKNTVTLLSYCVFEPNSALSSVVEPVRFGPAPAPAPIKVGFQPLTFFFLQHTMFLIKKYRLWLHNTVSKL